MPSCPFELRQRSKPPRKAAYGTIREDLYAASAEDEDDAKGSTAMEWERCLSAFGTVAVWGGGNIWMEGVAPMKGEGPANG